MTNRERILAAGVGLVVLLWTANWLLVKYQTSVDAAQVRLLNAQKELNAVELDEMKGKRAMQQLLDWRTQSLPRVADVAKTQYRDWLTNQLDDSRIKFDDVTASRGQSPSEHYNLLSYAVDGTASLEAVVKFLAAFYQCDQLHKITKLELTPLPSGKDLRVNLTVEAMLLTDADRDSGLNEADADRLALTDTKAYIDSIVGRDLFAKYVPPPPPRPKREPVVVEKKPASPPPPRFDDSEHAFVTGIVQSGAALQAWVNVRTTGEVFRLKAGDEFEIGRLSGTVRDVKEKQLVLETPDDGLLTVDLGDNLRQGVSTEGAAGS